MLRSNEKYVKSWNIIFRIVDRCKLYMDGILLMFFELELTGDKRFVTIYYSNQIIINRKRLSYKIKLKK